nr:hypothetical protein [uncultured Flavobacterium sp.]
MKILNTILAVVAIALLGSCSESDSTPTTSAVKDIYFAGYQINSKGNPVATFWKTVKQRH